MVYRLSPYTSFQVRKYNLEYSIIIPKGNATTFDNEYLSGEKLVAYFEEKYGFNYLSHYKTDYAEKNYRAPQRKV